MNHHLTNFDVNSDTTSTPSTKKKCALTLTKESLAILIPVALGGLAIYYIASPLLTNTVLNNVVDSSDSMIGNLTHPIDDDACTMLYRKFHIAKQPCEKTILPFITNITNFVETQIHQDILSDKKTIHNFIFLIGFTGFALGVLAKLATDKVFSLCGYLSNKVDSSIEQDNTAINFGRSALDETQRLLA